MSMLTRLTVLTVLIATFLVGQTAWAVTYYVDSNLPGSDSNNGTSEATPFLTIQRGHDVAVAGDLILVKDGTYTTASSSQLVAISRSGTSVAPITFRSMNRYGAKLNGRSNATSEAFDITTASNIVIQDFEIYGFGGIAIATNSGSNLSIIGNLIHDIARECTNADYGRVGIFSRPTYSSLTIKGNIFHTIGRYQTGEAGCTNATTHYQNHDHAIYLESNATVIANNIFYNMKAGWPLHLYPYALTGLIIANNVFAEPNTWRDGYIVFSAPMTNVDIVNNIFLNPTGSCGVLNGSGFSTATNVTIRNNMTLGGTAGCSTKTGVTFSGNLDNRNPLLRNVGSHDYMLTSTSPAIDAGVTIPSVTVDFAGIPRPQGLRHDIGAYEVSSDSSPPSAPLGLIVN